MKKADATCPVCGYSHLNEPPYDDRGIPSFELCPCCGTQFGFDDRDGGAQHGAPTHAEMRQRWIKAGMRWWDKLTPAPEGWNPIRQLRTIHGHGPTAEEMIAEIHTAFAGVRREGGVSWSECVALDNYETPEGCAAARASDLDTSWTQLVDDREFRVFPGIGGFSFIDAIGFRYYLPVAMIRAIRPFSEWDQDHFPGHLLRDINRFNEGVPGLLNEQQRRCIAHFILYMSIAEIEYNRSSAAAWREAIVNHWYRYLQCPR